jgi:hypothetical protein
MTLKILFWTFWGLLNLGERFEAVGYYETQPALTLPSPYYLHHPPQYYPPSEPLQPVQFERFGFDFSAGEGRPTHQICQPAQAAPGITGYVFRPICEPSPRPTACRETLPCADEKRTYTYQVADLVVPISEDLPPLFCHPQLGTTPPQPCHMFVPAAPAVYRAYPTGSMSQACAPIARAPRPSSPRRLAISTPPMPCPTPVAVPCDGPRQCVMPPPRQMRTYESELIELITRVVAPESWQCNGGQGSCRYYPLGMAVVITASPEVQAQVQKLLCDLRKKQEEVYKEFSLVVRLGEGRGRDESITQLPKITFCQHQTFTVQVTDEVALGSGTLGQFVRSTAPSLTLAGYTDRPAGRPSMNKLPDTAALGITLHGRVTPSTGKQVRVDLEMKTSELEEARKDGVLITGRTVRVVRHVVPGRACRIVLERDETGAEQRWLEFTVIKPGK